MQEMVAPPPLPLHLHLVGQALLVQLAAMEVAVELAWAVEAVVAVAVVEVVAVVEAWEEETLDPTILAEDEDPTSQTPSGQALELDQALEGHWEGRAGPCWISWREPPRSKTNPRPFLAFLVPECHGGILILAIR